MKGFLIAAIIGFGAFWVYQEEQDRKRKYVKEQLGQFDAGQLTGGEVRTLYKVFKQYSTGTMPAELRVEYDAIRTKYNILA